MAQRFGMKLALAVLISGAAVASADAATIFKGGGIITARTAACTTTYAVGDGFVMEYRANFAAPATAETMTITTGDTALLLTSTDPVSKKLTGPGTASVASFAFGKGMPTLISIIPSIVSTPAITALTPFAGLIGVNVTNFGIAGCTVSFAAGVAKITSPF